jgi:hypothetical protein
MAAPGTTSYAQIQDSTGPQTNPTTATVLADSGALATGMYQVLVVAGCSVAAKMDIQHRNAANGANVSDSVTIRLAAGQSAEFALKFAINSQERIRVLPQASITGEAEAAIQVIRIS